MNSIPNSALRLRHRNAWEAADSGVLLWRNNFVYLIPFFAIPVWAAACGLRLLPFNMLFSYLILWWLKPLFDRLVLHVVSSRFFGSAVSGSFKKLGKGLAPAIFRSLAGDLLWRRFSPARGSRMPVRVLERAGGKQFANRKKILARGGLNFCSLVSTAGLFMEAILLLSEISFVVIVAKMINPSAFDYMRDNMEKMELFIFAAFCFNYILVESLYVCIGFALYINSRIEVEGWDLQLLFQKFSGEKEPVHGVKTALVICLLLIGIFFPAQASAEQNENFIPVEYFPSAFGVAPEKSINSLEEILTSRDFGYEKDGWKIKYKRTKDSGELPDIMLSTWLKKIRNILGIILRGIIVFAAAAFISFAFYWLWKFQKTIKWRKFKKDSGAKMYQNPLLSSESPELLFAKAEYFFRKGFLKEAWAACLSGCLGAYSEYHSISFPANITEYGCLALIRGGKGKFKNLVQNWVYFAYGGIHPEHGTFEKALAFGKSIGSDTFAEENHEA